MSVAQSDLIADFISIQRKLLENKRKIFIPASTLVELRVTLNEPTNICFGENSNGL